MFAKSGDIKFFSSGDVTRSSQVFTLNTVFKMASLFPGSLNVRLDAKFGRFTTHALLPIFPVESWVLK